MPRGGKDRQFLVTSEEGYVDAEGVLARGKELFIDFYHTPTKNSIAFKAFITDYSETYEGNWGVQDSYGRIDPFAQYKNTQRRISLGWDVVAASEQEAKDNMVRCQELIQMMYPGFKKDADGQFIDNEAPTFRVKFANWIKDSKSISHVADTGGLSCYITNLQFNPDLEQGSFDTPGGVYPKVIKLSCAIVPYSPTLGTDDGNAQKFNRLPGFANFPFGHNNFPHEGGPPARSQAATDAQTQATAVEILGDDD